MMKKIYITLFIVLFTAILNAQTDITTHFMRSNPYSNSENPASYLPIKGYVGIPGIGNLNINFFNTVFHYNSLFKTDMDGYPITVTLDKFVDKLHKTENWLNFSLNEEILGFGFRSKNLFFSFSYRVKVESFFKFSKDLFELPVKGNMNFLGEDNPAILNADISLSAYQEISLGVQAEIGKRLYIGARPKFLLGIANINTNQLKATLYTNPDDYSITMNYVADITAVSAFPTLQPDSSSILGADFNRWQNLFDNRGFAIDLGGMFRFNDRFGVGASVNNIGFINWKTPGVKLSSKFADQGQFYSEGDLFFSGLTADQLINLIDDSDYVGQFLDTLKSYFPIYSEKYTSGTRWLNPRFNIEGYFQLNPNHRFSALFQGTFIGKNFYPRFTLAYSGRLGNILEVCVNYSIMPSNFANVGVGLGLSLGPIYLFAATDNIIGACMPFNSSTLNAQIGLAVKWGKVPEKILKKQNDSPKPEQEETDK